MHWHHTRNCNVNYEEKTKYHVQVQSHLPPNLLCRLHPTAVPNQIISLAEAVSQASLLCGLHRCQINVGFPKHLSKHFFQIFYFARGPKVSSKI